MNLRIIPALTALTLLVATSGCCNDVSQPSDVVRFATTCHHGFYFGRETHPEYDVVRLCYFINPASSAFVKAFKIKKGEYAAIRDELIKLGGRDEFPEASKRTRAPVSDNSTPPTTAHE